MLRVWGGGRVLCFGFGVWGFRVFVALGLPNLIHFLHGGAHVGAP